MLEHEKHVCQVLLYLVENCLYVKGEKMCVSYPVCYFSWISCGEKSPVGRPRQDQGCGDQSP